MMEVDARPGADFRHEALLYSGDDGFVAGTAPFIRDAVRADEPILVVVSAPKIGWLRDALGDDSDAVQFADMADVGLNPARIIPAWQGFVDAHSGEGRPFRGIGEPIWAERTAAQLAECQRHEALLNRAFAGSSPWWLLCPYDTDALAPEVIEEAHRSHPHVSAGSDSRHSETYRGFDLGGTPFDAPLSEPTVAPAVLAFDSSGSLRDLRAFVSAVAEAGGLGPSRAADLVLAATEVATNSLRHGGGAGTLRAWLEPGAVICEIRDRGHIREPLAGRRVPTLAEPGGRGLWLVNQVCDLVQIRTSPHEGTVVRLHMLTD